jgi:hypothetical protein
MGFPLRRIVQESYRATTPSVGIVSIFLRVE